MERNVVVEPRPRSSSSPSTASTAATLPADLQLEQSIRVQLLYVVGAFLWALNFVMDTWVAPHGNRGPYRGLIEGTAFALSIAAVLVVRYAPVSHRFKVDLGAVLVVPHALALALMNSWMPQATTQRPLSGITVLILFVGMLAPVRPRRMLVSGLVAAAMDPLAVWIAHRRGLPVPGPLSTVLMFYPNFVCAFLAVIPAQVLYRLGGKIREARALGSYHLVERLGEGGMGEVWLARHRLLARSSAIKLIRPEMLCDGSPGFVTTALSRFEREAQATASLTSPNTIRLYDFGRTADGTFFYAMELLDGCDLESLVRQFGPLKPARALHLVRQICRSLGEAHAAGLIHRDIKPANVYVCRMGLEHDFVKVLDFGLVRHEDRSQAATLLTREAGIVGTPAYMAPESIVGEGDVDRRADVYALGCVAYFLLTGRPVFGDDTGMKQLMRHVQDTPVPPSRLAPHPVPRALDDLVMACLQKDPRDRPQSAEALYEMAAVCLTRDAWDQADARQWWETHLPASRRGAAARSAVSAVASSAGAPTLGGPIAAMVGALLLAAWPAAAQPAVRAAAVGVELSAALEATSTAVGPSVVEIFTTSYVPTDGQTARPADLVTTQRGSGSGVIVDAAGYIVTNAHVVRGAQRLRVAIPAAAAGRSIVGAAARSVAGAVVGLDLETDLAVIKVDAGRLPALPFGDSDGLRAGQVVLAFGNPLGLQNTVSLGVVSAVARQLEPDSPMIYVQTDASIHSGSSGGPLVDLQGRLVGLNTLMMSRGGGYEGLGFAAPANIVRTVYEQIRAHGRVRRGDIGVRAQTITAELAAGLGLARDAGVVLADVLPRSPAAIAGLAPGDLVLALDGKPMENSRQLQVGLYRHVVGDVVTLDVLREGRPSAFPVAMTERLDAVASTAAADPRHNLVPRLGILAVALDPRVARLLPAVRGGQGVVVLSTVSGAMEARDGGLAPGDVIYTVNRQPVTELAGLRAALDVVPAGQPVVLHLERNGELLFLTFLAE